MKSTFGRLDNLAAYAKMLGFRTKLYRSVLHKKHFKNVTDKLEDKFKEAVQDMLLFSLKIATVKAVFDYINEKK